MKMFKVLFLAMVVMLFAVSSLMAADTCDTLKPNTINNINYSTGHYLQGQAITVGVDPYGYNYQAHLFAGSYFNAYAGRYGYPPYDGDDANYLASNPTAASNWAWPYRNDTVAMKWNDEWLSNKDCNHDGLLDRPDDNGGTYIGSGAWLTNHISNNDGTTEFIKIIAAPSNATKINTNICNEWLGSCGTWVDATNNVIGPDIWGEMAVIQDQGKGVETIRSPLGPGFGKWR